VAETQERQEKILNRGFLGIRRGAPTGLDDDQSVDGEEHSGRLLVAA
jgi:hypothetical protein